MVSIIWRNSPSSAQGALSSKQRASTRPYELMFPPSAYLESLERAWIPSCNSNIEGLRQRRVECHGLIEQRLMIKWDRGWRWIMLGYN